MSHGPQILNASLVTLYVTMRTSREIPMTSLDGCLELEAASARIVHFLENGREGTTN